RPPGGPVEHDRGLGHVPDGGVALGGDRPAAAERQPPGESGQRHLLPPPADLAAGLGPDQEGVATRLPGPALRQAVGFAVDDVHPWTGQPRARDRLQGGEHLVDDEGNRKRTWPFVSSYRDQFGVRGPRRPADGVPSLPLKTVFRRGPNRNRNVLLRR